MTNPRDLIQRLADSVELLLQMRNGLTPLVITETALAEARAYLAQQEPERPADEELINTYQAAYQPAWDRGEYHGCHVDGLRAVLARWGSHAPTPIPASERLPAVPNGREPTDEELLDAQDQAVASFPPIQPEASPLSAVEYARELEIRKARAVLARWGSR